jgi:hypothetical protein
MNTRSYHISNLGSYAPRGIDTNGYVTYHVSRQYSKASDEQLAEWAAESRIKAVRNAAITEQAERRLAKWQGQN